MKIRLIEQKPNECGLACVAMLTGKTTADVKRIIFDEKEITKISADDESGFYTYCPDLVKALQHFNTRAEAISFKSWGDLSGVYIVGVNTDATIKTKNFHWIIVIKDKGQDGRFIIIDPEEASIYYNGAAWVDTKGGYFRRPNSNIVKADIDIDGIDFSTITLAKNQ
ncbi:MAG TPA: cysteine peptidase family C39 domain-containing protein [Cellvibrio sp.]